eukprot:3401265-Alexandrium_andersonii.AAC.1
MCERYQRNLCRAWGRKYPHQCAGCSGNRPLWLRKGRQFRCWGPGAQMPNMRQHLTARSVLRA